MTRVPYSYNSLNREIRPFTVMARRGAKDEEGKETHFVTVHKGHVRDMGDYDPTDFPPLNLSFEAGSRQIYPTMEDPAGTGKQLPLGDVFDLTPYYKMTETNEDGELLDGFLYIKLIHKNRKTANPDYSPVDPNGDEYFPLPPNQYNSIFIESAEIVFSPKRIGPYEDKYVRADTDNYEDDRYSTHIMIAELNFNQDRTSLRVDQKINSNFLYDVYGWNSQDLEGSEFIPEDDLDNNEDEYKKKYRRDYRDYTRFYLFDDQETKDYPELEQFIESIEITPLSDGSIRIAAFIIAVDVNPTTNGSVSFQKRRRQTDFVVYGLGEDGSTEVKAKSSDLDFLRT